MGSKVTKGQAIRKAKRNVAAFDAVLERTHLTGQTAAQRNELADELADLAAKLKDNRTTLLSLLAVVGEGTADGRELVVSKASLDERLAKHAAFAENHAKRIQTTTRTLDPEEQSIVDTLDWIIGVTLKLQTQIALSESTIESALSSVSKAQSVAEEAKRMEAFNELLVRNEDRQWHVQQLELVESRFTASELSVKQVLSLKVAVDNFVQYNDSAGFKTDRSVYASLSLDSTMPKAAVIKPCHNVAYIHDSDEDAAQDPDVYDRISYDDLIAPPTLLAPREDEGWEVVEKKARINKEHQQSLYEQPEERAMREQREQAGRMPPKVYTAYENEMPVSERPRNYRTVTCREWLHRGTCSFGGACTYLHGIPETAVDLRQTSADENPFLRTRVCRRWQIGYCPDGDDECRYLHSTDLRDRQQPSAQEPAPSPSAPLGMEHPDEDFLSPRIIAERAKKPCKWFASSTGCGHGQDCHFKHEGFPDADLDKGANYKERLRSKHKTVLCDKFDTAIGCPYKACQYAHGVADLVRWGESPEASPKVACASPVMSFDLHTADFPSLAAPVPVQNRTAPKLKAAKVKTTTVAAASVAAVSPVTPAAPAWASAVASPVAIPANPNTTQSSMSATIHFDSATSPTQIQPCEGHPATVAAAADPQVESVAVPCSREDHAAAQSPRAERLSLAPIVPATGVAQTLAPIALPIVQQASPGCVTSLPPQSVGISIVGKTLSEPKPPTPPPSTMASSPPAPARPFRLLPLGPNACLNHLLMGSCLNGTACLARHVINTDHHTAGVKPMLGPLACLNWFLGGECANGKACLARHALIEEDYVQQAAAAPEAAISTTTLRPSAVAQHLTHPASVGQSFAGIGTEYDFRTITRPVSRTNVLSNPYKSPPSSDVLSASAAVSDFPDHLSRAVADLIISDDEDEVVPVDAAFDVSNSDGE